MIGVAFEVSDASNLKRTHKETDDDYELRKKHQIRPTSFDIINYSLCYIGLFSGILSYLLNRYFKINDKLIVLA